MLGMAIEPYLESVAEESQVRSGLNHRPEQDALGWRQKVLFVREANHRGQYPGDDWRCSRMKGGRTGIG